MPIIPRRAARIWQPYKTNLLISGGRREVASLGVFNLVMPTSIFKKKISSKLQKKTKNVYFCSLIEILL